jgi:hypothetical protein
VGGVPFDGAEESRAAAPGFGPRVAVEVKRGVAAPMPRVWEVQRSYTLAVNEPSPRRQLRERAHGPALAMTWTLSPGGEVHAPSCAWRSSCATAP